MKLALFLSLISSLNILPAIFKNATNNEENQKRVYVYFSDLRISDELFDVEGEFYTADGNKDIITGKILTSNGISAVNLDSRLWYFDINKKAQTCAFNIKDKNNELWSNTNLSLIEGCVFDYSMSSYSSFNKNMGWHNVGLQMDQFADYFISRIDTEKDTYTDGYMTYQSLNDSFFISLKDYSKEKESLIRWNDDFIGNTSFQQKWELIKLSYIAKYKPEEKLIWPYFLGAGLVLVSGYLGYSILFKKKVKRKYESEVL